MGGANIDRHTSSRETLGVVSSSRGLTEEDTENHEQKVQPVLFSCHDS
jgi:hypothetical protein